MCFTQYLSFANDTKGYERQWNGFSHTTLSQETSLRETKGKCFSFYHWFDCISRPAFAPDPSKDEMIFTGSNRDSFTVGGSSLYYRGLFVSVCLKSCVRGGYAFDGVLVSNIRAEGLAISEKVTGTYARYRKPTLGSGAPVSRSIGWGFYVAGNPFVSTQFQSNYLATLLVCWELVEIAFSVRAPLKTTHGVNDTDNLHGRF
ncbi:uncharacterized protein EDB93DRAFT_1101196 [Suillus bovinus]|uniref:uncharacterized protein n=1 Tax=Suillus bovinus TaxID=48563 RepID=UPI001B85EF3F|nr:uncharacterized protein EDB93DRAFT_1101196 [Suillus bovinus]KAG2156760.1 hypothetical protein EDB93DRAFT_1101196 [Suillus bovinus]